MSVKTQNMIVAPLRGMDQRWQVKPNSATSIRDMTWNDQDSWERAGGYGRLLKNYTVSSGEISKKIQNAYDSQPAPVSLHWFANHGGAVQYLVYETADGTLRYFNGSTAPQTGFSLVRDYENTPFDGGTGRTRVTSQTPWEGTQFCTFGGRLYMVNGFDAPLVFDGRKADRAGYSSGPSAISPEFSGRASFVLGTSSFGLGYVDKKCSYQYRVTFVNERGQESPASDAVSQVNWKNVNNPGAWKQGVGARALITVPLPKGPPGTVARRVYRTQNLHDTDGVPRDASYGQNYYYAAEIQDNTCTVYLDVKKDVMLGSVLVESDLGPWPPTSNRIASFKGTLFLTTAQNDNVVKYSAPGYPEVLPIDNEIDLSDSTSGSITGLYGTQNALVVFKERGIYLIKGDPSSGFYGQTLTKDVGCTSPGSLREVPGVGLAFLSTDGIYLLQGALGNTGTRTTVVKISQPIRDLVDRINFSAAKNVRSVVYHQDMEYWLFVPTIGKMKPDLVLKFHYEVGAWSFTENFRCRGAVETEDHRGLLIFAADYKKDAGPRGLYVYSKAFADKGGYSNIEPKYETSNLALGSAFESFSLHRIQAQIIGYGNNSISLNYTTNREMTTALTADVTSKQKRVLEDSLMPVYGTTTWGGGDTYVSVRPIPVRFDVSHVHKGPVQEFRCSFEASKRVQILNYEIAVRTGAAKKKIVLNENFGGTVTR